MGGRSWMAIYWADYFGDTRHLSRGQHGAYLLLIGHYWMHGSLPDDDRQLASITCSTLDEWRRDKPVIKAFFYDGWKHKRVEHELARHQAIYEKRLAASEKGNAVRAINRFRTKR